MTRTTKLSDNGAYAAGTRLTAVSWPSVIFHRPFCEYPLFHLDKI